MTEEFFAHQTNRHLPKLDPRSKIAILLIINIFAFTVNAWMVQALSALIPLSLLLLYRRTKLAVCCGALYAAALLCSVHFGDSIHGLFNILLFTVCGVITRMTPGLLMGYYLLKTTSVSEFVAAMQRLHMPKAVIVPFSVMFRFFPTIRQESAAIQDAMRMRGIHMGNTRGGPLALLEYRLVPLFISCVKIGEELSSSALTRGLSNPAPRTNICTIGFQWLDALYMGLAALALLLFLVW